MSACAVLVAVQSQCFPISIEIHVPDMASTFSLVVFSASSVLVCMKSMYICDHGQIKGF